jgi:hypothetical protein
MDNPWPETQETLDKRHRKRLTKQITQHKKLKG